MTELARTTAKHRNGISPEECDCLRESVVMIARHGNGAIYITLGDELLDQPPEVAMKRINHFRTRLSQAYRRAKVPPWFVVVLEVEKGLHAHIIALDFPGLADRIRGWSEFYGAMRNANKAVQHCDNPSTLASRYLTGEATSQARYGRPGFVNRQRGSHKLPCGFDMGDRVRPSKELNNELVRQQRMKPSKRTIAQRKPRPAPVKFRDNLFDDLPALPPPAFDLAAERQRRGLSQRDLASLIGSSQPHIANVERGHDRLSPARLRVLRHVLDRLPVAA